MKPKVLKYEDLKDFVGEKVYVVYVDSEWCLHRDDLMSGYHKVKQEKDLTFDLYDRCSNSLGNAQACIEENKVIIFSYQPLLSELLDAYNRRFK